MIREYALDPEGFCDWNAFRHVAMGLGFSHGRVVAAFPKDWKRRAYGRASDPDMDQNTKKKIEVWLQRSGDFLVDSRRGRQYESSQGWYQNACEEHDRSPFHAIIAEKDDPANPPRLDIKDVDDDKPLWQIQRQIVVARNANGIGPPVSGLFRFARQIRVVDPYFLADPGQMAILFACLPKATSSLPSTIEIELHVSGEKVQPTTLIYMNAAFSRSMPNGWALPKIIRWRPGYLHNRFFLTDRGGIMLGDSIQPHDSRPDQLTLLEKKPFMEWWAYHDKVVHVGDLSP